MKEETTAHLEPEDFEHEDDLITWPDNDDMSYAHPDCQAWQEYAAGIGKQTA